MSTLRNGKAKVPPPLPRTIRARAFQAVTFFDVEQKRQVIVLYTLGEDGIVREYVGGKWNALPVSAPQ